MGLVSFNGTAIMGINRCRCSRRRFTVEPSAQAPSTAGSRRLPSKLSSSSSSSSRCWYTSTEPLSSASSSASNRTLESRKLSSSATVCLMSFLLLLLFLRPPPLPTIPLLSLLPPSFVVALNHPS